MSTLMLAAVLFNPFSHSELRGQNTPALQPQSWNLIWQDNFDSSRIDTQLWHRNDWRTWVHGRDDLKSFRTENENIVFNPKIPGTLGLVVKKEEHVLERQENILSKTLEPVSFEYSAPRWLMSNQKFKYGYFEIRCRVPVLRGKKNHRGIGANFWLYTQADGPVTYSEIDVLEFVGRCGKDHIYTLNAHYAENTDSLTWHAFSNPCYCDCQNYFPTPELKQFHTFGMAWFPDRIEYYLDDSLMHTIRDEPEKFFSPSYLLPMPVIVDLNVFIPNELPDKKTRFPYLFEVDYVKVYEFREQE